MTARISDRDRKTAQELIDQKTDEGAETPGVAAFQARTTVARIMADELVEYGAEQAERRWAGVYLTLREAEEAAFEQQLRAWRCAD